MDAISHRYSTDWSLASRTNHCTANHMQGQKVLLLLSDKQTEVCQKMVVQAGSFTRTELLARACDVPVGRRLGGRLATTLVATINIIIFHSIGMSVRRSSRSAFGRSTGNDVSGHKIRHYFFSIFSIATFSLRRSARIKKLSCKNCSERL